MLQMKRIVFVTGMLLLSNLGMAQLKIGDPAPGISLLNKQDSIINLSGFSGNVVLIDFWASWCAPCRAANPYIQKLFKKYHANGFEVFAVSLDVKKEAWLKAIKKDRLTYTQVYDAAGWNSKVAERFFVDMLPTNFLLDRSGKIVGINLEGKELFDKVKSLVQ